LPDDGMYFIVSPKDIVTARQRDEDDHITWLLEHEMFVVSWHYFCWACIITQKSNLVVGHILLQQQQRPFNDL